MRRSLAVALVAATPAVIAFAAGTSNAARLLSTEPSSAAQSRPLGITGATVIDVERGTRLRDYTVVIEGGRIATVGPSSQVRVPDGYGVINARGKFIVPGLIDTHVHLMWDRDSANAPDSTIRWLKSFVPFGVTTVREASARDLDRANMRWRDMLDYDGSPVPRVYVSGRADRRHVRLANAGGVGDLTRQLVKRGVDGIKIRDELTLDEVREIVAAADGRPVFGHTYYGNVDYTRDAVLAGVNGVMHVSGIRPLGNNHRQDQPPVDSTDWQAAWLYRIGEWLYEDTAHTNSLIRLMVSRGVWLEPTLVTEETLLLTPADLQQYPGARYLRHSTEWWRDGFPMPTGAALDRARASIDGMKRFVRRFHAAGGVVVTGTDGRPFYAGGVQEEMRLLVEAGLTPAAALRAATSDAARALRWQKRVGAVAPGRLADLLILDANPLDDIRNASRINAVVFGGRFIDAAERERLLAALAAR